MKSERYREVERRIPDDMSPYEKVLVPRSNKSRCWHYTENNCEHVTRDGHNMREVELIQVVPIYKQCTHCAMRHDR